MKRFRLSIRGKFTGLIFLGAWLPLTIAFAFIATQQLRVLRRNFISESILAAKLVGGYGAVDLAFRDQDEAAKTLAKLKELESILFAGLYDVDGRIFSSYGE